MNVIRSIISKPFLTLISLIGIIVLGLIAILIESYWAALALACIAGIIIIFSLIYALKQKKYGRFIIYLAIYLTPVLFVSFWWFVFHAMFTPQTFIVTDEFYNEYLVNETLTQDLELEVLCKKDKIITGGFGASDYRALCIYKVNETQAKRLEIIFNNDSIFDSIESSTLDGIIEESKTLVCSQDITYDECGYKKYNHGLISYFIFSGNKQYLLFYIDYWR